MSVRTVHEGARTFCWTSKPRPREPLGEPWASRVLGGRGLTAASRRLLARRRVADPSRVPGARGFCALGVARLPAALHREDGLHAQQHERCDGHRTRRPACDEPADQGDAAGGEACFGALGRGGRALSLRLEVMRESRPRPSALAAFVSASLAFMGSSFASSVSGGCRVARRGRAAPGETARVDEAHPGRGRRVSRRDEVASLRP